jgi:hypothetical protein
MRFGCAQSHLGVAHVCPRARSVDRAARVLLSRASILGMADHPVCEMGHMPISSFVAGKRDGNPNFLHWGLDPNHEGCRTISAL